MLAYHKEKNADCTIASLEVPWEEASRFGLMFVNDDGSISEFEEKPKHPRSNKASSGRIHIHLEQASPLSARGRGEPRLRQRLRPRSYTRDARSGRASFCLSVRRLLEGCRHDRQPLEGKPRPASTQRSIST